MLAICYLELAQYFATSESIFFYHLGLAVAGFGGLIGGIYGVFLPRIVDRLILGVMIGIAVLLVDAGCMITFAPTFVFTVTVGISMVTGFFSGGDSDTWVLIFNSSLVGSIFAIE